METDALKEVKEKVSQKMSYTNMAACCCLALDSCLDSSRSRTAKFGIECIADG